MRAPGSGSSRTFDREIKLCEFQTENQYTTNLALDRIEFLLIDTTTSCHRDIIIIIIIIIIIVYYAEAARHTDNRYYNTTHTKNNHANIKHKTGEIK